MDGYAVRAADVATLPATLTVIGEAAAGHPFAGSVGAGQAVRIFTGAPVPDGRRCHRHPGERRARRRQGHRARGHASTGGHIRPRGFDFRAGDTLLAAGRRLGPREVALAAAMGHGALPVRRRPRVAILATGDELVPPGAHAGPRPDRRLQSPGRGRAGRGGGRRGRDCSASPATRARASMRTSPRPRDADVLVTIGGASVGDHDLVAPVLEARGMALAFWKIAMRPGKPLMFGRLGPPRVLGLPGNPVSSLVCTRMFLVPLIRALLGRPRRRGARHPGPRRRGAGGQRPAPALHARHLHGPGRRPGRRHARALPGQLAAGPAGRGRLPARPPDARAGLAPAASCRSCRSTSSRMPNPAAY